MPENDLHMDRIKACEEIENGTTAIGPEENAVLLKHRLAIREILREKQAKGTDLNFDKAILKCKPAKD